MNANIGWLYYKAYYQQASETRNYQEENQQILECRYTHNSSRFARLPHEFRLKTLYPGLLIGTGYQHETGGENELKIGFYFDYSTGLPQIPGSSVKGMLRSCFPFGKRSSPDLARMQYIQNLLQEILETTSPISEEEVKQLELEIFSGCELVQEQLLPLSIYQRDRFFDAVLDDAESEGKRIFDSDFITPHEHPLKAPVPVMFLKVRPNVCFRFRFQLQDSRAIPSLTKTAKLKLFQTILLDQGVGAKTNVGYGQFSTVPVRKTEFTKTLPEEIWEQLAYQPESENKHQAKLVAIEGEIYRFEVYQMGTLISTRQKLFKKFEKDLKRKLKQTPTLQYKQPEINDVFTIEIKENATRENPSFTVIPIWL